MRRAFGEAVSLGATYRYYVDDWSLDSHTALADVAVNLSERTMLAFEFRYYTQSVVAFYRARYLQQPSASDFLTHDRELSPMGAERLGLHLQNQQSFDDDDKTLTLSLSLAGALFHYDDFVGLESTRALEVTTAISLSL